MKVSVMKLPKFTLHQIFQNASGKLRSNMHQPLLLSKQKHPPPPFTNARTSAYDNPLVIDDSFHFWMFFDICVHPISNITVQTRLAAGRRYTLLGLTALCILPFTQ